MTIGSVIVGATSERKILKKFRTCLAQLPLDELEPASSVISPRS